ncbi:hypothetical protein Q0M94_17800 (plasmid) [Deinococcus radiomollis]|uniref:hypothetical protein n=1 Tax=Deinococcus radiomollis TaxID=468916 RepID=UPI0038918C83
MRSYKEISYSSPMFQAILLIGQTYSVVLIGLIVGIFSARGLSVIDRGTLSILLLIAQFCSRFGSLGFEQVIQRNGVGERIGSFYGAGLVGTFATFPIALISISFTKISILNTLFLVVIAAIISILRINVALLVNQQKIKELSYLNVSQAVSQLIFYALVFHTKSLTLFFASWCINVTLFSIISIAIVNSRKSIVSIRKGILSFHTYKNIWHEGFQYIGIALPEMVTTFCLELPIIRLVLGGVGAGLYTVSNTMTNIYYQMFVGISAISIKRKFSLPLKRIYILLLLICIVIIFISGPVLSLVFGHRYVSASLYARVMLPVTWLLGVVRIQQVSLNKMPSAKFQTISSCILIGLIFLGIVVSQKYLVIWIAFSYIIFSVISLIKFRSISDQSRLT